MSATEEWLLILFYGSKNKEINGITELMNRMFLMYQEIIPYEDLGLEFRWKKNGVYSADIEDTVDDMVFAKYLDLNQNTNNDENIVIRLTDKGTSYVDDKILDRDSAIIDIISVESRKWDERINRNDFASFLNQQFKRYLSSDPRTKRGDQQLFSESKGNETRKDSTFLSKNFGSAKPI